MATVKLQRVFSSVLGWALIRQAELITKGIYKQISELEDLAVKKLSDKSLFLLDFWLARIRANHSVMRRLQFSIVFCDCDKSVVAQLIRATKGHPQPFVQSSRPDRTGMPRDPEAKISFIEDYTTEAWIELCKQRLCFKTEDATREVVEAVLKAMRESKDPFFQALEKYCMPACQSSRLGCPELSWCGKRNPETGGPICLE